MKIISLEVGQIGTNCYIAYCADTKEALVIDPGGNPEDILNILQREKLKVTYIVNTHGHADHIAANKRIQESTGAKILIHQADGDMLTNAQRNLSSFLGGNIIFEPADKFLSDGDMLQVGNIEFSILHTPGHTPGGICLKTQGVLFSGDTLFAESVGRTDFPGGSMSQLIQSIKSKLMTLPDETRVLPGHGSETSIGWERTHNPYIQ